MKIEKYESDVQAGKGQKLNEDQRAALEKKEDVAQLIREFEDVYKQMEERDVEVGSSLSGVQYLKCGSLLLE